MGLAVSMVLAATALLPAHAPTMLPDPLRRRMFPANPLPANELVVGDFDGDGVLDVLAEQMTRIGVTGPMQLHLGNGDGSFRQVRPYTPWNEFASKRVEAADIDGDGDLDPVATRSRAGTGGLFVSDGRGRFTRAPAGSLAAGFDLHGEPLWLDADADGDGDLLMFRTTVVVPSVVLLTTAWGGSRQGGSVCRGVRP